MKYENVSLKNNIAESISIWDTPHKHTCDARGTVRLPDNVTLEITRVSTNYISIKLVKMALKTRL